jgi:hypothetical protein
MILSFRCAQIVRTHRLDDADHGCTQARQSRPKYWANDCQAPRREQNKTGGNLVAATRP